MADKENKTGEHEVIIDTKDDVLRKDDEINDRINKLYGNSKIIVKKDLTEYDPKEVAATRKKLLCLFGIVVLVGILIIFLLINPIFNNKQSQSSNNNEEQENTNNESGENNLLGELDLSLDLVTQLNNKITFNDEAFKNFDLFLLYTNDTTEINSLPDNIKLYFLTQNTNFYNLLTESGVDEYINNCDTNGLVISKESFDNVVQSVLGPNVTINYPSINYNYYGELKNKKITLTYSDNKYVVKCNEYKTNDTITKFIQQEIQRAIGTESGIELYQKVVFISQQGVFLEPSFKTLITNDKEAILADYIKKGNTYKYTFTKEEDNYYLSKIELVKEDN